MRWYIAAERLAVFPRGAVWLPAPPELPVASAVRLVDGPVKMGNAEEGPTPVRDGYTENRAEINPREPCYMIERRTGSRGRVDRIGGNRPRKRNRRGGEGGSGSAAASTTNASIWLPAARIPSAVSPAS